MGVCFEIRDEPYGGNLGSTLTVGPNTRLYWWHWINNHFRLVIFRRLGRELLFYKTPVTRRDQSNGFDDFPPPTFGTYSWNQASNQSCWFGQCWTNVTDVTIRYHHVVFWLFWVLQTGLGDPSSDVPSSSTSVMVLTWTDLPNVICFNVPSFPCPPPSSNFGDERVKSMIKCPVVLSRGPPPSSNLGDERV